MERDEGVLIAGAGPVGLITALGLAARAGCDRRGGRAAHHRLAPGDGLPLDGSGAPRPPRHPARGRGAGLPQAGLCLPRPRDGRVDPVRPRSPRGRHGLPVQRPPRAARARSHRAASPRAHPRDAGALRRAPDRADAGRQPAARPRRSRLPAASASCGRRGPSAPTARAAPSAACSISASRASRGRSGSSRRTCSTTSRRTATRGRSCRSTRSTGRSSRRSTTATSGASPTRSRPRCRRRPWRTASPPPIGRCCRATRAGRSTASRPTRCTAALRGDLPCRPRAAGGRRRARDEPDRRPGPHLRDVRLLRAAGRAGGGRGRRRERRGARRVGGRAPGDLHRDRVTAGEREQARDLQRAGPGTPPPGRRAAAAGVADRDALRDRLHFTRRLESRATAATRG